MAKKKITEENIEEINTQISDVEISEIEVVVPKIKVKKNIFKIIGIKKILVIILLLLVFGGGYTSYYFYKKSKIVNNIDATTEAVKETQRLVGELGKIMELPTEETPTIATISDKDKLKDQPFFAQAQNGDVLFAYTSSMRAILYRPSTNKIVNIAPINIDQPKTLTGGTTQGSTDTTTKKK